MAVGERAMTLVEVVVAAAVVLVVVIAASNAVVAVDQTTTRSAGRDAAEAEVAAQLEELRSLPFSGVGGAEGPDVVSSVFPHADPGRNTPDAVYDAAAQGGRPAGTFLTVKHAACGPMTIAATFVVSAPGGFVPLAAARLAGYDARQTLVLPAADLLVCVSLAWRSGAHSGLVARTMVVADRPRGLCLVTSPSAVAP
jgi:Tfp pilus assembly protein PilE